MYYEILRENIGTGELDTFWIKRSTVILEEVPEFPPIEGFRYLVLRRVDDDFIWSGFAGSRHLGWE